MIDGLPSFTKGAVLNIGSTVDPDLALRQRSLDLAADMNISTVEQQDPNANNSIALSNHLQAKIALHENTTIQMVEHPEVVQVMSLGQDKSKAVVRQQQFVEAKTRPMAAKVTLHLAGESNVYDPDKFRNKLARLMKLPTPRIEMITQELELPKEDAVVFRVAASVTGKEQTQDRLELLKVEIGLNVG
jgi:hypothetical protein